MSLLDDALKEMDFEFGQNSQPCGGEDDGGEPGRLVDFHRLSNQQEEEEMEGGKDVVTMDMPFMIRIFELVRENIKTDEDLHHVADKLLDLSRDGPVTMDHYEEFREFEGGDEADMEPDMDGDDGYPEAEEDQGFEGDMEPDMEQDEEDLYASGPISVESLLAAAKRGR